MGIPRLKFSHLRLTKGERSGFFIALMLCSIMLITESLPKSSGSFKIDLDSSEVAAWLASYDSVIEADAQRALRIHPFNPNFITPAKADRLGLTAEEYGRFQEFRETGNWINSAKDFQRVTQVSENWLKEFSSFFKFPKFVNKPKLEQPVQGKKIPFALASEKQLMRVYGIGPAMSKRIIDAGEKWGGIANEQELLLIYGITAKLKDALLRSFVFDEKNIIPRNINTLYPSDLTEIPGISFSLAKSIWEFVRLRQGLKDLKELHALEEIQPLLFEVIQLYLYAMKNEPEGI